MATLRISFGRSFMQLEDTMLKLLDGRNLTVTSREKLKEEDFFDY